LKEIEKIGVKIPAGIGYDRCIMEMPCAFVCPVERGWASPYSGGGLCAGWYRGGAGRGCGEEALPTVGERGDG